MNYLKEVLKFNNLISVCGITPAEQSLWHALMGICNALGWQKQFTVSLRTLALSTNLSQSGIISARDGLIQKGFLIYTSRGRKTAAYEMVSLIMKFGADCFDYGNDCDKDSDKDWNKDCGKDCGVLNKQNKNKNKTNSNTDFDTVVSDFTADPALRRAVADFIEFRRRANSPFTSASLRLFLDELKSFGNPPRQLAAVRKSLISGWKSLVPPKKEGGASPPAGATRFSNFQSGGFDFEEIERRALK